MELAVKTDRDGQKDRDTKRKPPLKEGRLEAVKNLKTDLR